MREDAGASGDEDFREAASRIGEDWVAPHRANEISARAQFKVIFRRALYIIGVQVVLVIILLVFIPLAPSLETLQTGFVMWFVLFVVFWAAYIINWRCPICGGFLGQGFWGIFSVSHCMRCGARLE